jgi:hypothetical protein
MAPPVNTTIGTAIDLGTLPVLYTQEQSDAGTTYPIWTSLVIPTGVKEIGPWAYGNFTTWNPVLSCWRGPIGSPTQIGSNGLNSRPLQIAVDAGETIYFESVKPAGNVTPALTTIDILAAPAAVVPTGSILINDSSDGYPLVAISPTTTQTVLNFYHPFPAGESNRVLTSGEVIMADAFGSIRTPTGPIIYGPNLVQQSQPTMPAAGYLLYGTDQTTGWWAMKSGGGVTHPTAVFVAKDGTVSLTVYDLGALGAGEAGKSITPNLANTKLYYILNTANANKPVKVITIPGAVVSDFIAGVANYILTPGLTTMLDDTLLVGYSRAGVSNEVRRFDTAGLLTNTYLLGASDHPEQIFTAIDDPNSFWVWTISGVTNRFRNIKVSDGSVLHDVSSVQFVEALYQDSATATPTARFGTDFSCVPWISRAPQVTTQTFPIRRQRRFLLPSSDDNKNMSIPIIEILMRTGIGLLPDSWDPDVTTPLGANPEVRIRLSKDGGETWGPERILSAGLRGRFKDRVRILQATGNYRNAVLEVTVDAPVDWQFLAALGDPVEGSS